MRFGENLGDPWDLGNILRGILGFVIFCVAFGCVRAVTVVCSDCCGRALVIGLSAASALRAPCLVCSTCVSILSSPCVTIGVRVVSNSFRRITVSITMNSSCGVIIRGTIASSSCRSTSSSCASCCLIVSHLVNYYQAQPCGL
ncbi:unnamed protein product [Moneuplotes crassus]|uniref:Uncharacterized protein n=1 Tax=Euplotes crassus TaxID=5936 RepID=A0AAD2D9I8_EUPCR|nr:unnamed protein product [Moneuplotes crassus]